MTRNMNLSALSCWKPRHNTVTPGQHRGELHQPLGAAGIAQLGIGKFRDGPRFIDWAAPLVNIQMLAVWCALCSTFRIPDDPSIQKMWAMLSLLGEGAVILPLLNFKGRPASHTFDAEP